MFISHCSPIVVTAAAVAAAGVVREAPQETRQLHGLSAGRAQHLPRHHRQQHPTRKVCHTHMLPTTTTSLSSSLSPLILLYSSGMSLFSFSCTSSFPACTGGRVGY